MAIALSLIAALLFGTGDFFGGVAAREARPLQVAVAAHWAGLGLVVPAFIIFGTDLDGGSLAWGAAAGASGAFGVVFLFRALSAESMSVAAATIAITSAVIPVMFGVGAGERPAVLAWFGILLGTASLLLIVDQDPVPRDSRLHRSRSYVARLLALPELHRLGVVDGVIAGLGFGTVAIFFSKTTVAGGLWPMLSGQIAGTVVLSVAALAAGAGFLPPRRVALPTVVVGVFHVVALSLYLLALQRGFLSLVAVVMSLYPVTTIFLARYVLDERMVRRQKMGLLAAGIGVALIALG